MSERRATGLTVLVVEDDEDIRLAMRFALEEFGYRVDEAANGEEAIEVAWRTCPNIILMDLSLPVLDGLAATRRIRQDPQMKDVPIVAVTAHHESQFRANALAAGCNAYITKPIDFNWLDELMGQLLPEE
ncbi:MAG: response regulator [Pyrinomonadaceae bacterium]|nr:response regulator [Pyrinomonadaceae bacterium]